MQPCLYKGQDKVIPLSPQLGSEDPDNFRRPYIIDGRMSLASSVPDSQLQNDFQIARALNEYLEYNMPMMTDEEVL